MTKLLRSRLNQVMIAIILSFSFLGTGCQSINQQSTSHQVLPAHKLMQMTMMQRFDKSYNYEKTTQYQLSSLHGQQDVEKLDQSLWLTIITKYLKDYRLSTEKSRKITQEQLACEEAYNTHYNQILDQHNQGKINQTIFNQHQQGYQNNYNQCLEKLPKKEKTCEEIYEQASRQLDTQFAKNAFEQSTYEETQRQLAEAYTTCLNKNSQDISLIKETYKQSDMSSQHQLYRVVVQSMIDFLNELEENPATHDVSKSERLKEFNSANLNKILLGLQLTPQQIEVINQTYLKPKTISYMGSYHQPTAQFSTVLEEKNQQKFIESYRRIPVLIDMNEMSITFEPDVILPIASLLLSNDIEIPKDISGKSIKLSIPEDIRQNIPLPLLKDSFIKSIGYAYGDLEPEKFSEVIADDYAKSIHASRVIKINMTSREMGLIFGRTLKYWAKELKQIQQKHPEYINNNEDFRLALELLTTANKYYRANDLAKIAQLIESILPLSYNGYNYYYFDKNNQLIGYRKITDYSSNLFNASISTITTSKIHYTDGSTQNHKYYQPNPATMIDGNQLIKEQQKNAKLKSEASYARFGYNHDNLSETESIAEQE